MGHTPQTEATTSTASSTPGSRPGWQGLGRPGGRSILNPPVWMTIALLESNGANMALA